MSCYFKLVLTQLHIQSASGLSLLRPTALNNQNAVETQMIILPGNY